MPSISANIVKFFGVIFCLIHLIKSKGRLFVIKNVLIASGLYFFQGAIFFFLSNLSHWQQWEFAPSVINDSIASIIDYLNNAQDDSVFLGKCLWEKYGLVTFLNFPNFYFILALLARENRIVIKVLVLYTAWCLLIGYAQTELLPREIRQEKVRQEIIQEKINKKLYHQSSDK